MSPDIHDPQELHYRLKVLEDWREEVRQMLHEILTNVRQIQRAQDKAPAPCPAPGTCLQLREMINRLEATIEHNEQRLAILERIVWIAMGGASLIYGIVEWIK